MPNEADPKAAKPATPDAREVERHGQQLRFEHIRDAIERRAAVTGTERDGVWELLVFIAEEQMYQSRHFGKVLHHIERMERHIMAADDAIFTDLTQMSNDVGEMQAGIANLLVQIQAGNTQGATDEANKIQAALDPLAASLRSAASQFDPSPTPPAPSPAPTSGPRAVAAHRNAQIAQSAAKSAKK